MKKHHKLAAEDLLRGRIADIRKRPFAELLNRLSPAPLARGASTPST